MSEGIDNRDKTGATGDDARSTTDEVRRKLLKAGAIGIPVAVSLQSGTAWAISNCASRLDSGRPTAGEVSSALDTIQNRALIMEVTGISDADITTIISETLTVGGAFPEVGSVQPGEVLWLLVNSTSGGSCWTYF